MGGESRGRGLRKPLKSIGKKSQVLRREAKGIKTPLKGVPPKLGGERKGGGVAPFLKDERREGKQTGDVKPPLEEAGSFAATAATMSGSAVVLGGAEATGVQGDSFQGVATLREGVKTTLSSNLLQVMSLKDVGYSLHQCLLLCCKPWSMAELPQESLKAPGSLAYAMQGDPSLSTWENATTLALQHMAGLEASRLAELRCDPAEKSCVRAQLQRFDVWDEKFDVVDFERFWEIKTIGYTGDEVKLAQHLNWTAVENSLPEGVGHLKLTDFCTLGTRGYVERFEDFLLPDEMRERLKPPRVMVEDNQWDLLCKGLIERNICKVMPLEEVYHLDGEPLLNGLFAVGKGEFVGTLETQRLIMNLTPVNHLCRELSGDIATLPTLANFGLMTLGPDEVCLISSEDVRCFFYLFETPVTWHRYMGFNREVSPSLVPPGLQGQRCVLAARVLPMGFANSVSIAQHIHRNVIKWACMAPENPIGGEGEIRKDKGFPSCPSKYRVYLDNFDQLEIVDTALADEIKGTPSAQVLAVRQMYTKMNLPRHPKKAVTRQIRAEVQGALVLGDKGIALPKPQKLLQYIRLGMELLVRGECKLRELQVVCGGLVYFTGFRRPLLSALNAVWRFMEELKTVPPVVRLPLPESVLVELVRFLCLVPLAQLCFTSRLEGTVTCSDASSGGGGMCASSGLSAYGLAACATTIRGDIPEEHDIVQVLSIGLFDGLGALRVACDVLGLPMAGHVSIEQNAKARRVVEAFFPDSTFHDNVLTVDEAMVRDWSLKYSNAGVVLIGAGPPCQGVSGLNADKRGALKDPRSKLFSEVPRIKELVQRIFFWAQVHLFMESVASMDDNDRWTMSQAVDLMPWRIDALGLALCRRPRLYWVTWELRSEEQADVLPPDEDKDFGSVTFSCVLEASKYLEPGWVLAGPSLPTFTTARPSLTPGRKPAGLHTLNEKEKLRWQEDLHRFPPYQYAQACGLVNKKQEWRAPSVSERELCMGFPLGYTKMCMGKQDQKGKEFENTRLTLLGNSWCVPVVCWLLKQLFFPLGLCEQFSPQMLVARLTPGAGSRLQSLLLRPPLGPQRKPPVHDPQGILVKKLMGIASIKGEDLLLQASTEHSVRFHRLRASIPAGLWRWRDIAGWAWKGNVEHINCLEMRAVYTTLKWWTKKRRLRSARVLHLVDSLACLHALSRGRTSSRKLRRTLMRINSLILSHDLHPIWGYVHTSQNPADRPSRRVKFVKRKWAR